MPIFGPVRSTIPNFPIQVDLRDFRMNADLIKVSTFRMARQLGDMTVPLKEAALIASRSMSTSIDVGGRPPWPFLTVETIVRKSYEAPEYITKPLLRSGYLYDTLYAGKYWRISRDKADMEPLDTVVPYAKFHQKGTRNMPARPFAVLQQRDIEMIVVSFDSWINRITSARDFWPYNHREL